VVDMEEARFNFHLRLRIALSFCPVVQIWVGAVVHRAWISGRIGD
jgi:hypothetical protein